MSFRKKWNKAFYSLHPEMNPNIKRKPEPFQGCFIGDLASDNNNARFISIYTSNSKNIFGSGEWGWNSDSWTEGYDVLDYLADYLKVEYYIKTTDELGEVNLDIHLEATSQELKKIIKKAKILFNDLQNTPNELIRDFFKTIYMDESNGLDFYREQWKIVKEEQGIKKEYVRSFNFEAYEKENYIKEMVHFEPFEVSPDENAVYTFYELNNTTGKWVKHQEFKLI